MRMQDKVAIVTGAGSGIGRASALLFAAEGAAVMCQDLNEATASETASAIRDVGGTAAVAGGDVTDPAAIEAMFEMVDTELGVVTTVMSNAGVSGLPGDGGDGKGAVSTPMLTDQGFFKMLEIHLGQIMYLSRAAIPRMTSAGAGGSIIGLSSIAGLAGMGGIHYSTAKGGVLGFVKSLAREVGPQGIRVNAICPGVIDTPMTQQVPPEYLEPMIASTPLRRLGTADDIANSALFLGSEESAYVTGQWISPNGGIHMG